MARLGFILCLFASTPAFVSAAELPWPPQGRAVRAAVTRDTWVSCCQGETLGNLGGEARLKTKAFQEITLIDLNPVPLQGFVVAGATLHLHCASKDIQKRLGVSSLASEWVEGTGRGYQRQPGASCFLEAETGRRPWAYPGSDLTAVMFGEGHTIWSTWDASPPDRGGWQVVAVDPRVVAARIAGISHGFVVFDDTGSEWTRNGESFRMQIFPNRFIHSRESGQATAPYFTVYLGAEDEQPPGAPSEIRREGEAPAEPSSDSRSGSAGASPSQDQAIVSRVTPADRGPAGTLGFLVRYAEGAAFDWTTAKPVPRYLIPMAGAPGQRIEMHLRDLALPAGATLTLGIKAVDGAGNVGPLATATVQLSPAPKPIELGGAPAGGRGSGRAVLPGEEGRLSGSFALPRISGAEVFVVDPLDGVNPVTGAMIPPQPPEYLAANHLWSAKDKLVRLYAARNEFVAFQIGLRGQVANATATLKLPAGVKGELLEFRCVGSKAGPLPDPLVPLKGSVSVPSPTQKIDGQRVATLLADLYVPHDAAPGKHTGTLEIAAGGETLSIAIELNVWDFTLPDVLSFVPEMNSYGLPAPPAEAGYYRVAHAHRTCMNRLPYSQNGSIAYAPRWDGQRLDWTEWDRHFGPYLDGSAFADLPRARVPVDTFYLPLHENWPASIFENYNGSYWADRAFPASYRETFVRVARLFAEHFAERGWTNTFLEFYLNNKSNFKERGWSRGSSPWILDEPASFQDFWALRWFALAFHEAMDPVRGATRLGYRIDISRPEWERDSLNGLEDMVVCSGAFRHYRRMILDRQRRFGTVVFEYGSSNRIGAPNVQSAAWCISAWCLGADGVLPWQTIGTDGSWTQADELSLFYPGSKVGSPDPVPSIRLKAYRRGQQDVEYLTLLAQTLNAPRWAVGEAVQRELGLAGTAKKGPDVHGVEDAGTVTFDRLSPASLWELRTRVGAILSKARPEPKRRLVDLRTPTRDVSKLPSFLPSPRPAAPEESTLPRAK